LESCDRDFLVIFFSDIIPESAVGGREDQSQKVIAKIFDEALFLKIGFVGNKIEGS